MTSKHTLFLFSLLFLFSGCAQVETERQGPATSSDEKSSNFGDLLLEHRDVVFQILRDNPDELVAILEQAFAMDQPEPGEQQRAYSALPLTPSISLDRPMRGNPDAAITVVEYSDFLCPYCSEAAATLGNVLETEDVRLFFKHMPISPASRELALAFEALALQGHDLAWEFHDAIFSNQEAAGGNPEQFIRDFVQGSGADQDRFAADWTSPGVASLVDGDISETRQFGITGAPSFLFNGFLVQGALPRDEFQGVIEHIRPRTAAISNERFLLGNPDASVTMVMYADFLCNFSADMAVVVDSVMAEKGDDVRLVFKHMPIIGQTSRDLAQAFEALAMQSHDLAWDFAMTVFDEQEAIEDAAEAFLSEYARAPGIDAGRFHADRQGTKAAAHVDDDLAETQAFGYFGVPMFLINGRPVHGVVPEGEILQIIEMVRPR